MKKFLIINVLILILPFNLFADDGFNCFSVIAGKKCTVDGSVLFGHNEDDSGDMIVNMYKVPAMKHSKSDSITLKNGSKCPQVRQTNAYIWLEMPGMEFSDGYLNEHAVAFASDNCPSREDSADISDGGIGYWLRRLMAERVATAREAVKIGGALIKKYGYTQAGRSYCIADPNEAWVMSVVKGKHWVAQRVPDDHVMIVPNYYVMQEVDLSDTLNYLGSKDIITYAIERGWYNPETDGVFNFREVYGAEWSINHTHNINREWGALRLVSDKKYNLEDNFPFSIKPNRKLDLVDIFAMLRDHYEGTMLETRDKSQSPHNSNHRCICDLATQYAFVAQLRNSVPKEMAAVMWYSPVQPCLHPFVPVYGNVSSFPENFAYQNHEIGLKLHFDDSYSELKKSFEDHAFIEFTNFAKWVNEDFYRRFPEVANRYIPFEKRNMDKFYQFDMKLHDEFMKNPANAQKMLDKYSHDNLKMLISIQND